MARPTQGRDRGRVRGFAGRRLGALPLRFGHEGSGAQPVRTARGGGGRRGGEADGRCVPAASRRSLSATGCSATRHIGELIEAGCFRPVIDRRYPLERIADAYRYDETGQKTGGVVITVVPPK
ncbi:zinc-binding dehydrogenase [Streptomyces chartreusis]|uniref:zinc-binding dehydrogenase n=1 Tax=Streptomyces chartreusis TaxID=1969 RepID=UPI0033F11BB8